MNSPLIATHRPLAHGVFRPRLGKVHARNQVGFSLLELTIVVALILIVTTIALLMAGNVTRSVHLQTTAADYANLLQQARIRAVQDDKYYSVVTANASSSTPAYAFVDLNGDGSWTANPSEPEIIFAGDVKPVTSAAAPAKTNLESQFLPSVSTYVTVNTTANGPTFGPRGIPCAPTTNGSYTTCPFTTATSYMTFMKNVRSSSYEAITVSPAGRIRLWSYSGSSGTWSPMN
jgi:prepilin-type N-terminal cleavage/methylation domain-containing protein